MQAWLRDLKEWQYRRALAISFLPSRKLGFFANLFGAGHTLRVVYQLHYLCMQLRRYCYVRLYDTEFQRYFKYEGELSWDIMDKEARLQWRMQLHCIKTGLCANVSAATISTFSDHGNRSTFWNETLLPALMDPKYAGVSFLNVRVYGHLPRIDTIVPDSVCFNRFVTKPPTQRFRNKYVPPLAVHLRTGFADVDGRIGKVVATNENLSISWFRAACGGLSFSDTRKPQYLISDSPGLLRTATTLYPHLFATISPPTGEPTRSWFTNTKMKFLTLDDIVLAGMANEFHVATQQALIEVARSFCGSSRKCLLRRNGTQESGFVDAVTSRSVCITTIRKHVPECPHWPDVFVRDLISWLNIRGSSAISADSTIAVSSNGTAQNRTLPLKLYITRRWPQLLNLLPNYHPCRNLSSGTDCYLSFVAALK